MTENLQQQARDLDLDRLAEAMLQTGAVVEQPLEHLFVPGLYVRKIFNPKGSLIVTATHKTEHPFVLLSGHLRIYDQAEGRVHDLRAPKLGVTAPGTRRVIYAVEDSVFVTFHPNPDDETDLDALEERYVEPRGENYLRWRELLGDGPKELAS